MLWYFKHAFINRIFFFFSVDKLSESAEQIENNFQDAKNHLDKELTKMQQSSVLKLQQISRLERDKESVNRKLQQSKLKVEEHESYVTAYRTEANRIEANIQ